MDYLYFYIKVMEFKKETTEKTAKLAAGTIIDDYLTEEASSYIQVSQQNVEEILNEYEISCKRRVSVSKEIFNGVTKKLERELMSLIEEFREKYL